MATAFLLHKDKLVLELMGEVLRERGHKAHAVHDLATGTSVIAAAPFDLAILDLASSPTSWTGLTHLRDSSCRKDIAVMIIAQTAHAEEVKAAATLGARGYIVASQFTLDHFLKQVEKSLSAAKAKAPARPAPAAAKPQPAQPKPDPRPSKVEPKPAPACAPALTPATQSTPELLRSIKPIISSSQLREVLKQTTELKALSPTVARVLDLTRSAGASVESVVNAIKCDQAIALRIIKLANSAVFQRGDRVNTVKAAVLRIGMQQIQQAVSNIGVIERFSSVSMEGFLNHVLFWEHCLGCGIVAAQLAAATKACDTDTAFTLGLLHDIGRMLLAENMPDHYLQVLTTSRETGLPLDLVEKRMLLTTHAEIMQEVLRAWNFPRHFADPIACHQASVGTLRAACPSQLNEAALLALADRLCHAMLLGCSGSTHVADIHDLCELLRVPEQVLAKIIETAEDQTHELKLAMLSAAATADLTTRAQQLRQSFDGPFRPLFINAGHNPDSFGIMCKHLADTAEGPATVAVVHARNLKEKPALAAAVLNAEKAAGLTPLPLIVISPNAQVSLEDALPGRQTRQLPDPLCSLRFAAAIKSLQAQTPAMAA